MWIRQKDRHADSVTRAAVPRPATGLERSSAAAAWSTSPTTSWVVSVLLSISCGCVLASCGGDGAPASPDVVVDTVGGTVNEPPWTEGEQSWAVFAPDGRHVADARVPASALTPCFRRVARTCTDLRGGFLEIGADYILLAQRDELGVVMAPLRQPAWRLVPGSARA